MDNNEALQNVVNDINTNVEYVKKMSDDIVKEYTGLLDELMKDIADNIIGNDNVPDAILEKYFLELTNAMYFIGSKSEFLGLYEDLSKANMRLKYNQAFSDNQINGITNGKKPTVDENRVFAENSSMNETIVNSLYSRSFRIIKSKVESANEMIKTLSKIISKRMNERDYSDRVNPFSEGE